MIIGRRLQFSAFLAMSLVGPVLNGRSTGFIGGPEPYRSLQPAAAKVRQVDPDDGLFAVRETAFAAHEPERADSVAARAPQSDGLRQAGRPLASEPLQGFPYSELDSALEVLEDHLRDDSRTGRLEISNATAVIAQHVDRFAEPRVIARGFKLVELYETRVGPLFINTATRGGFPRTPAGGLEIHRALFAVQQALLDRAFSPENLEHHSALFTAVRFKTSDYFPGPVDSPAEGGLVHEVKIDASQPSAWGGPVMYQDEPARRPTGGYLAPGSIGTVTVPASLVGKGFKIRVGAHSWDLAKKPKIRRLDRVSLVFPITRPVTRIANPLGGGIYLEVPYKANEGIVTVRLGNTVRSPFFSARGFARTSLEEWVRSERSQPGPWADFESDKFMMQVPSAWIRDLEDPVTLMQDWDQAMDAVSELFGLPLVRSKTVLYMQNDVLYRGSANFPGYPMSNDPYRPEALMSGDPRPARGRPHYMIRGPQFAPWTTFHELGHAQLFTKFRGETESAVNLPYVAIMNRKFGMDLDTAFAKSIGNRESMTRDRAAITWMVTPQFQAGRPMGAEEMKYQHRGHAKYVDIAGLFGWKALDDFWRSVQLDYTRGITYPRNADPADSRILRLSQAANADLTPLIHFWGVHPGRPDHLKTTIREAGLKSSRAIYDRLCHYRQLIPMNNEAFRVHIRSMDPNGTSKQIALLQTYDESHGQRAREALQEILDHYFPKGRPPAD